MSGRRRRRLSDVFVPARPSVQFAAGCFLALIVMLALHARADRAEANAAQMAAATSQAVRDARHFYPAAALPRLQLPGGRQEIVRSILNIAGPLRFGRYVWDETGVPDGPVWVRVDPARQVLSVFRAGHEIGSAVILYGANGKPTPTGSFPILEKQRDYHSRTYDAPMPFMLRLTDDGVAIHGSDVRKGGATHGCIGVPVAFAQLLFEQVREGEIVAILPAGSRPDP